MKVVTIKTGPQRDQRCDKYTVYEPGDTVPVKHSKYIAAVWDAPNLKPGRWIQTIDNYVVQVIAREKGFFRIVSTSAKRYSATSVKKRKADIYFNPPPGYFGTIQSNRRLRLILKRFAWLYAKTGDKIEAAMAIYDHPTVKLALRHADKALAKKGVRQLVKDAFKEQLALAGLDESKFVAQAMLDHQKSLSELVEALTSRIKSGDELSQADADILGTILQHRSTAINDAADLLNYRNGDSNDHLLTGGFSFEPPQITEATVIEHKTNGVDNGKSSQEQSQAKGNEQGGEATSSDAEADSPV